MEHLEATALLMKKISRFAIEASADLAQERGSYELFSQSEWAKGVLPYDTAPKEALELLPTSFEWYYEDDTELRAKTSKGMRNSHIMAIAPTATISHIVGTTSCTELPLELITVEENLSGNFISRSPVLKHIYAEDAQTARDVDQVWVIMAAAVRQVYIDQAQSTNMYIPLGMEYADGTKVTGSVISGWRDLAMKVLKTVYYLRGVSAGAKKRELSKEQVFCSIDNPQECEACQ
jgi:ribonucleoside-diphosphate reductase alpha chain